MARDVGELGQCFGFCVEGSGFRVLCWVRDDLEDSLRYVMSLRGRNSQKLCDVEWCEIHCWLTGVGGRKPCYYILISISLSIIPIQPMYDICIYIYIHSMIY